MTVQELIDELSKLPNKDLRVTVTDWNFDIEKLDNGYDVRTNEHIIVLVD